MGSTASEIALGLLGSVAIFVILFVVLLGPLDNLVFSTFPIDFWDGVVALPYALFGVFALLKGKVSLSLIMLVSGLLAALVFNGFLFGARATFDPFGTILPAGALGLFF